MHIITILLRNLGIKLLRWILRVKRRGRGRGRKVRGKGRGKRRRRRIIRNLLIILRGKLMRRRNLLKLLMRWQMRIPCSNQERRTKMQGRTRRILT